MTPSQLAREIESEGIERVVYAKDLTTMRWINATLVASMCSAERLDAANARLDALEAENERLRSELATARTDALEDAAQMAWEDDQITLATRIRALKDKPL